MKVAYTGWVTGAVLMFGAQLSFAADLDLAKASGCLACHAIDAKLVGPSWKDVNARYAGVAGARDTLIDKIKLGGRGNWTDVTGGVPMPPYSPRVSDDDIAKLVDFVLNM